MNHILMTGSLVFILSVAGFSQTNTQKGPDNELKQQVLRSPMMGFEVDDKDPFRILYSGTYAVKGSDRNVELKLVPKNQSGKTIRAFTVYCEEEFSQMKDGSVVREVHRITAKDMQPVLFQVQKDSSLTFWVGSIQFEDGTVLFIK